MTMKTFLTVMSAATMAGVLMLSGCATDNMKSMDDSMDHHSMDKSMTGDSMEKSDDMGGMKGSM